MFGRKIIFLKQFEKIVRSWETKRGYSGIPMSEDAWETGYLSKKWNYLREIKELARYSVIIGYMTFLKQEGAVLDVGCGEGILFDRFRPYGYSRYLGIDISETSLTKLMKNQDERTSFIKVDAETYSPGEQFDIIVFNESLYYFHDPFKTFEKYTGVLKKNGVLIVSTFTASKRAMSILNKLKATYSLMDESKIFHDSSSRSWICSVFKPN
jgi:2-polyprenyl-3-methyl-5-hydroxy-6-metoxy-1,4-benzoquinol methylase